MALFERRHYNAIASCLNKSMLGPGVKLMVVECLSELFHIDSLRFDEDAFRAAVLVEPKEDNDEFITDDEIPF